MVEFKTKKAETIDTDKGFIEVARKIAVSEDGTENEFIAISKGFYLPDKSGKRYRKSISLPNNPEVLVEVAKKLKSI
jgi:hypothetical protein